MHWGYSNLGVADFVGFGCEGEASGVRWLVSVEREGGVGVDVVSEFSGERGK